MDSPVITFPVPCRGMLAKAAKTVAKSTPIPMREMAIHSGWKKCDCLPAPFCFACTAG